MQQRAISREFPLAGRVALVTGVSRRNGIGFATARRLAQLGAHLFIHSWAPFDAMRGYAAGGELEAVLAGLRGLGRRVEHAAADLADPGAPAALIAEAAGAFGHVDVLVLNHAHSIRGALEELTAEEIDRHLAVNVRASLLLLKEWAARHDDAGRAGALS